MIDEHNVLYQKGQKSYSLRMNKYGDMTNHEITSILTGYKPELKLNRTDNLYQIPDPSNNVNNLPRHVDWRRHGLVTPIKDQGNCGSCYAFSATGALEGQNFLKTGKLVSLSEQNIVDCSGFEGNNGCNGGNMDLAFKYVKDNGGIDTEESYPYDGVKLRCRYNKKDIGATEIGFVDIPSGDKG